ncbi:alpha/beta hydrolase [Halorussus litoreus]|uniref:alpha/beta hydrolase n=1 Tax=Halorussus litoreus TaxID=1710536 RepID=UPI000E27593A|nr:dienelactone hydrolase family protein [Halorussus litoreus]
MAGRNPHRGDVDPHEGQPVGTAGAELADADAAVLLVHGRGATAESMLEMVGEFATDGVTYLAPQAKGRTWYPNSFLEEIDSNEPSLSSALALVGDTLDRITDAGVPTEKVALVGFSQGACLSSEFVARNAERYGGLAALSGGLIGPEGTPRDYDGDLGGERTDGSRSSSAQWSDGGTPVFLGCSDVDPHIPVERVHETRDVLADLGADVTERIYEGMGHGVNEEELEYVADLVAGLTDGE